MKLKFLLFLFIFITPCLPVLANYKGVAKEKHVKKAQYVEFGVDGTRMRSSFNFGAYDYYSKMFFYKLHNEFYITYYESSEDSEYKTIESLFINLKNRPYIEKDANGTITIIGQGYYSYNKSSHVEKVQNDCRLFITLTPTDDFSSIYACKIYAESENTEPLIEKMLCGPYFRDRFGDLDYRDLKKDSDYYKFFWLWLEQITSKFK